LTGWWTRKNNWKKWRAEEEERHKGSLAPKKLETGHRERFALDEKLTHQSAS
jgi:hypothetical protein